MEATPPGRRAAAKLATKLLSDCGQAPPVVLREVFKHVAGKMPIAVKPVDGSEQFDGVRLTNGNKIVIAYNKNKPPTRQRFTLAHELGHCLLGHGEQGSTLDLSSKEPEEIEANAFAAELLIPRRALAEEVAQNGFDPETTARRYKVSVSALWWRLRETNLMMKVR